MAIQTAADSITSNQGSPFGFKNRIINGGMVIDQRNSGTSVTAANQYSLDRWCVFNSQSSKFTFQQNAGSVTPPAGFTNYLGITSSSAYSITSGDYFGVYQRIEGYNIADLGWGTASAKTVTLSFWVYSSLGPGTFGGAIRNDGSNRGYPFTYTINTQNTWEYKTVTIPGDTTGSWLTTNGTGISVQFSIGTGSTYSFTAGAWGAYSSAISATGTTSVVGTSSATWYITGVQLEVGQQSTAFDYRDYGRELILCQRYCVVYGGGNQYTQIGGTGLAINTTQVDVPVAFPVPMRTIPSASNNNGNAQVSDGVAARSCTALDPGSNQLSNLIWSLRATVASGLTQFRPYRIESNNTNFTETFSAEL